MWGFQSPKHLRAGFTAHFGKFYELYFNRRDPWARFLLSLPQFYEGGGSGAPSDGGPSNLGDRRISAILKRGANPDCSLKTEMPPLFRRELDHLRGYVEERSRPPFASRDWPWGLIGPLGLAAIVIAFGFLAEELPIWLIAVAFPIALLSFAGVALKISWALREPRDDAERREVEASQRARVLGGFLHRRQFNPLAGQILESCAYQRDRVRAAIEGLAPGRLPGIREHALAAANEGVDDAIAICLHFAGNERTQSEWRNLAQDVAEGRLGGAIQRIQDMLESGKPGRILDRKDLPPELWPAYEVAIKLQRLATEIESAARKAVPPVEESGEALDQMLRRLAEVRTAEEELDRDRRLNQG